MKINISLLALCFIICGCITEYNATGIDEQSNILVVEGIITDDETYIRLTRSVNLTDVFTTSVDIEDANVYVECDDGTPPIKGYLNKNVSTFGGWYLVETGKLDFAKKYRIKIEIKESEQEKSAENDGSNPDLQSPVTFYEYYSEFSNPYKSPEIDSVFWTKEGLGQMVWLYVATHSPDNNIKYYRWSFIEDWEFKSRSYLAGFPEVCWNKQNSRDLIVGSSEKSGFGQIIHSIRGVNPYDRKLSHIYRITVKQNVISKRAFDYYTNVKKNADLSGGIFAPIPSELRGNIFCATDPDKQVIGYIDVSSTSQKQKYIYRQDKAFEDSPAPECILVPQDSLLSWYQTIPEDYVLFDPLSFDYIYVPCVDCTYFGTQIKPDDWPDF